MPAESFADVADGQVPPRAARRAAAPRNAYAFVAAAAH